MKNSPVPRWAGVPSPPRTQRGPAAPQKPEKTGTVGLLRARNSVRLCATAVNTERGLSSQNVHLGRDGQTDKFVRTVM